MEIKSICSVNLGDLRPVIFYGKPVYERHDQIQKLFLEHAGQEEAELFSEPYASREALQGRGEGCWVSTWLRNPRRMSSSLGCWLGSCLGARPTAFLMRALLFCMVCFPFLVVFPADAETSKLVPELDTDEVYVLWGGIGYLNKKHQPYIAALTEGKSSLAGVARKEGCWQGEKQKPGSGHCLPYLASDAARLAQSVQLAGSAGPVVVSGFDTLMESKGITVADQLTKSRANLVLSVVSSMEYFMEIPETIHQGANLDKKTTIYNSFFLVALTGLVTVAKEGDIVYSFPILVHRAFQDIEPICPKGKCREDVMMREFGHAYSQGIEAILAKLPEGAATLDPARARGMDTEMVTLTYAHAKLARELFHTNMLELSDSTNICDPQQINPCASVEKSGNRKDFQACQSLMGLVAQGVSESLAARGKTILPPLAWQAWADAASFRLENNVALLKLDTAGANKEIRDYIMVRMGAENANRWLVAKFVGVVGDKNQSGVLGTLFFRAYLDVLARDGDQCSDPTPLETVASITEASMIRRMVMAHELNQELSVDLKRGLWLLATLNAIHALKEQKK